MVSDETNGDGTDLSETSHEPFAALTGSELSAVTFVRDYVQLQFEGPQSGESQGMNLYTPARSMVEDRSRHLGEPGYRDMLCDRIGQTVRRATTEVDAEQIVIEFADGAVFSISLHEDDFTEPEAAEYWHELGQQHIAWVVWRTDWND